MTHFWHMAVSFKKPDDLATTPKIESHVPAAHDCKSSQKSLQTSNNTILNLNSHSSDHLRQKIQALRSGP
ncbi:hypothetical protein AC578_777 [Pseudocercospora eumusae]|uniref:Uncharacterized protein n=1 Tax=Pseudocercospora eumusae TaxID=321146 RepID=A0A139HN31_9PEZI|nr:hypothetical protein AC578_777 [Pseudocercospora eumusae]